MACPKCGCKETYQYVEDDILGLPDDQERCAACGAIFYFEDHTDEDDDEEVPNDQR
jgi:predicted nucleic-acid-binding Zn-ribbon protein